MNTQAFNSDDTRLRSERESSAYLNLFTPSDGETAPQTAWEALKYIRPIVIIDEPQRVEGTAKKPSQSMRDKHLTEVERIKINCGRLHFNALDDIAHFAWVISYRQFIAKTSTAIGMKK